MLKPHVYVDRANVVDLDNHCLRDIFVDNHPLAILNNKRLTAIPLAELKQIQKLLNTELKQRMMIVLDVMAGGEEESEGDDKRLTEELGVELALLTSLGNALAVVRAGREQSMCPDNVDLLDHHDKHQMRLDIGLDKDGKPILN